MSTLLAVRHGQASFFADNYDQLSEVGHRQAERLAEYWLRRQVKFDAVFTGPRARQVGTAKIVTDAYHQAGVKIPEAVVLPGLDEYEAEAVLNKALAKLTVEHDEIRRLQEVLAQSTTREEQLRNFQKIYEIVIMMWARGELAVPDVESWETFCKRTHDAYDQIVEGPGSRRVAAFTSGGPVGVAMQRALDLPMKHTLEIAWMVRNASFSEFLFTGKRFTLTAFNAFPHLDDDPKLLTYR